MRRVLGAVAAASLMFGALVLVTAPPGYTGQVRTADDVTAPEQPIIISPSHGTELATNRVAVEGTGEPGAKVTVKDDGGGSYGPFTVSPGGEWSGMATDLPLGDCEIWAIQTDAAGNVSPESVPVFLVTSAPRPPAPKVNPIPAYVTASRPTVTGTGSKGAPIVMFTNTGKAFGAGTVTSKGTWSVTARSALSRGPYAVAATQKVGGVTSPRSPYDKFRVVSGTPLFYGARSFSTRTPTLTGVGYPTAKIYVKTISGTLLGTAIVDSVGRWSIKTRHLSRDKYTVVAKQKYGGTFTKSGQRVLRIG